MEKEKTDSLDVLTWEMSPSLSLLLPFWGENYVWFCRIWRRKKLTRCFDPKPWHETKYWSERCHRRPVVFNTSVASTVRHGNRADLSKMTWFLPQNDPTGVKLTKNNVTGVKRSKEDPQITSFFHKFVSPLSRKIRTPFFASLRPRRKFVFRQKFVLLFRQKFVLPLFTFFSPPISTNSRPFRVTDLSSLDDVNDVKMGPIW